MFKKALASSTALICALSGCGTAEPKGNIEATNQAEESIVRGTPEAGRPYVVLVQSEGYGGMTRCSGSYFAPRVVLTAGHCIRSDAWRVLVYFGSNYEADLPLRNAIPAPGQPTVWAKADSVQLNPNYSSATQDADMAVLYLDRKLPFDPLPLYRNRLDASWVGRLATEVGWGASKALSADIRTTEGFGIKRTGAAPILGTPTEADYHPDDPNPGMLIPSVREHYVKMNGQAPYPNGCAGDSGGPIIVNQWGQDYIAGVASWTGLWCEDYSLYTRIDPYLPFLDEAYRRGGQATLIPHLECVDTRPDGKLAAYFGYDNQNGVTISVPYGTKNYFPLDVNSERPSLFQVGQKHFDFGVDFTSGQTAYWKLLPENSPTTELRATSSSPRCADGNERKCLRNCEATVASACAADFGVDWHYCMDDCMMFWDWVAGCEAQNAAYLDCVAPVGPAAENWHCDVNADYMPRPVACDAQNNELLSCLGF